MNCNKDNPMYTISKLLLNSLYGRFGMSPEMDNCIIIDSKDSINFCINNFVIDLLDLGNGKVLITYTPKIMNSQIDLPYKKEDFMSISVAIASAITAAARVKMNYIKLLYSKNLYYSDTDNIDIDVNINPKFVGKELGKMKLENEFNEITYLAPKVYAGITDKGEYSKIKGIKNKVPYSNIKDLLIKNNKLIILNFYADKTKNIIFFKR